MDLPLYRRVFPMNTRSFYLLVGTFVVSTLLVATFFLGVQLWLVGALVLVVWIPVVSYVMTLVYRLYGPGVACLFVLLVSQTAHFIEHIATMVQIHLLGLKGTQASGIIGQLNNEWVHLLWNTWVLLFCFILFIWLRKNPWLYVLFAFGIFHEIEHLYIISQYVQTGIPGNPGLLAKGGLIGGGLPITRPDLHFYYAVFEESLLVFAYLLETRRLQRKPALAAARAG